MSGGRAGANASTTSATTAGAWWTWYRKRLWNLDQWIISIVAFITVNILITVTIYLILRPIKTNFNLQNASVFTFNVTSPPNSFLSSTLQVTISAGNPNDNTGIYCDCVDVFATYKNQQITLATDIPPFNQRHNDVTVWSPYLSGVAIPLAPYAAECLTLSPRTNRPAYSSSTSSSSSTPRSGGRWAPGPLDHSPLPPLRHLPGLTFFAPR